LFLLVVYLVEAVAVAVAVVILLELVVQLLEVMGGMVDFLAGQEQAVAEE
jgi:hypothetical protein